MPQHSAVALPQSDEVLQSKLIYTLKLAATTCGQCDRLDKRTARESTFEYCHTVLPCQYYSHGIARFVALAKCHYHSQLQLHSICLGCIVMAQ